MEMISSSSNPRIKRLRKLHDRKERDHSGLFFCEGLRIVAEALRFAELLEVYVAPELLVSEFGRKLVDEAQEKGLPLCQLSGDLFRQISSKEGPQGIAALGRQRWTALEEIEPNPGQTWVALDSPQDPGNVGTILRTNDAVGGAGIILIDHSTDPYDPTAIRGSMGALFTQRHVKTSWPEFAAWKTGRGIPLVGTSGSSKLDYHHTNYPDPVVLLMGSERQGLQQHHLEACDQVVSIPMQGKSDSLNLASATGIVLYELFNQRRDALERA
jgi:TrmH family RNA methyltransferase